MENENNARDELSSYDFGIIDLIKKGWARMEGAKMPLILAFLIYILIAGVVQYILGMIFPQGTPENPHVLNQLILTLVTIPFTVPAMIGMIMMAVKHVRGEAIEPKMVFDYYRIAGVLSLGTILIYLLTALGLVLLILPGIYLSVSYIFALALIADKDMGIWDAMEYSRKKVTQHWFKVFGLTLLLGLIIFLGAIPLGIGLIWAIPLMFVTLYGLLYTIIFDGVEA